jgi:transcriptional regulator with XRE-family HTH domain
MKGQGNGNERNGLREATAATDSKRDPVVWNSDLDAIVRVGYARGWSGAREAINEIQSLHPKWRSHNIWERAKELGFDRRYVQERPPWSAADDAFLLDFAQEQSVKTIARLLHRSERSVRWRFAKLGESCKVQDNYSQEDLARDLRVSPKTVRRWEEAGFLERRDGRITHESLEEFCRKHASEINYDTLDREMQRWLREDAGFIPAQKQPKNGNGTLKHLQKVGVCAWCGRKTRGNAHGRHIEACARKNGSNNGVDASGNQTAAARSPPASTTKSSAARRQSWNEG